MANALTKARSSDILRLTIAPETDLRPLTIITSVIGRNKEFVA